MDPVIILLANGFFLAFVLLVLLIVLATKFSPQKPQKRKKVKDDINKIKDQINGED